MADLSEANLRGVKNAIAAQLSFAGSLRDVVVGNGQEAQLVREAIRIRGRRDKESIQIEP